MIIVLKILFSLVVLYLNLWLVAKAMEEDNFSIKDVLKETKEGRLSTLFGAIFILLLTTFVTAFVIALIWGLLSPLWWIIILIVGAIAIGAMME